MGVWTKPWGLSPRVRGNRLQQGHHGAGAGSIPARAGEPIASIFIPLPCKVYPRACGGTGSSLRTVGDGLGLSPRVRGNPCCARGGSVNRRSIPARAGEPSCRWRPGRRGRVYPRACGGTLVVQGVAQSTAGLSPRVRGNHRAGGVPVVGVGSIPARAGEPRGRAGIQADSGVYPRACGGTSKKLADSNPVTGLSPRVRGNLSRLIAGALAEGSIPARAGEPESPIRWACRTAVYPRACGGTDWDLCFIKSRGGLSPRVRGNPGPAQRRVVDGGSIPARAGEPSPRSRNCIQAGVYPRACGGTIGRAPQTERDQGLSPRVRGNRKKSRRN